MGKRIITGIFVGKRIGISLRHLITFFAKADYFFYILFVCLKAHYLNPKNFTIEKTKITSAF